MRERRHESQAPRTTTCRAEVSNASGEMAVAAAHVDGDVLNLLLLLHGHGHRPLGTGFLQFLQPGFQCLETICRSRHQGANVFVWLRGLDLRLGSPS